MNLKMTKCRVASVAIAIVWLPLITTGGVASASGPSTQSYTTVPMTFVGVSSKTLLSNGTTQLNLANGQVLTVATSTATQIDTSTNSNGIQPDNTVYGDCGYAEIYISPNSNNSGISGLTGWDVSTGDLGQVVSFEWGVAITNITYNRNKNEEWGGPYTSSSWFSSFYDNAGTGNYHSEVQLANGSDGIVYGSYGICESAGPLVHSDTIVS